MLYNEKAECLYPTTFIFIQNNDPLAFYVVLISLLNNVPETIKK